MRRVAPYFGSGITAKPAKSAKRIKKRVSLRPLRSLRFKKTVSLPCILTCGQSPGPPLALADIDLTGNRE